MIPDYPRGGDPSRRARLHWQLYGRRRVARALDRLLGVVPPEVETLVDYRATGLVLGVRGRDHAAPPPERLAA